MFSKTTPISSRRVGHERRLASSFLSLAKKLGHGVVRDRLARCPPHPMRDRRGYTVATVGRLSRLAPLVPEAHTQEAGTGETGPRDEEWPAVRLVRLIEHLARLAGVGQSVRLREIKSSGRASANISANPAAAAMAAVSRGDSGTRTRPNSTTSNMIPIRLEPQSHGPGITNDASTPATTTPVIAACRRPWGLPEHPRVR